MMVSKQKQDSKRFCHCCLVGYYNCCYCYYITRSKALEFARNIPKPKISNKQVISLKKRRDGDVDEEDMEDEMEMDQFDLMGISGQQQQQGYDEDLKLRELEAKHLNSKKQIDMIRKSMGY